MPGTSKLFEMLQQACAFPVGIPAYKVDPEVTETFDLAKDSGVPEQVTGSNPFAERNNRPPRE